MMLLIGDGTLCLLDGIDAAVRSGGNWVAFFLHLNIIAWFRLVLLVFREVCIRLGISYPLQKQLDAFIMTNEALASYMSELERIDRERFEKESTRYYQMMKGIENARTEDELNVLLKKECDVIGLQLPYNGDFNDFMHDKSSRLEFK